MSRAAVLTVSVPVDAADYGQPSIEIDVRVERREEGLMQQTKCATPGCQEVADCGSYCTDHMFARLGGE